MKIPRRALARVAVSLLAGALSFAFLVPHLPVSTAALVGWDAAGLALLAISWGLIGGSDARSTRERAAAEDPGRTVVYVIVVLASAASLLAATVLVRGLRGLPADEKQLAIVLCLTTVSLAWAMTHTAFTFRYAHLYYREDEEGIGGLTLPGDDGPPTYADFAYFAFTIGMCFQVSDVCVTSRQLRRSVLLHALISFAYNTVILAFVLNLVFGIEG